MSERGLAHLRGLQDLVQKKVAEITEKALETTQGLFKQPGEEGYNPDAERNWAECSTKTRAALKITEAVQASTGADPTPRVLGVIFMNGRSRSKEEWEAEAKRVDEEARGKALDAEVVGG